MTWTLKYGCSEWQSEERFEDQEAAAARFDAITASPETMGLYTMEYATLEDPNGRTVAGWDEPSGGGE